MNITTYYLFIRMNRRFRFGWIKLISVLYFLTVRMNRRFLFGTQNPSLHQGSYACPFFFLHTTQSLFIWVYFFPFVHWLFNWTPRLHSSSWWLCGTLQCPFLSLNWVKEKASPLLTFRGVRSHTIQNLFIWASRFLSIVPFFSSVRWLLNIIPILYSSSLYCCGTLQCPSLSSNCTIRGKQGVQVVGVRVGDRESKYGGLILDEPFPYNMDGAHSCHVDRSDDTRRWLGDCISRVAVPLL